MFPPALLVMVPIGYLGKSFTLSIAFFIGGIATVLILGIGFFGRVPFTLASVIEAVVLAPFAGASFLIGRTLRKERTGQA